MLMADLPGDNIFECQQIEKILQIDGLAHILRETFKQAVMASFKTGKTHDVVFAKFFKKIKRHFGVKNTEIGKVLFQAAASYSVRRSGPGSFPCSLIATR